MNIYKQGDLTVIDFEGVPTPTAGKGYAIKFGSDVEGIQIQNAHMYGTSTFRDRLFATFCILKYIWTCNG